MSDFGTLPGRPGRALATQGGPKNSKKNDFLLKNGVPNAICCRFLCTRVFFVIFARFFIDFSRKIDETSTKKRMHFFTAALVFFNMATLTKYCKKQYESYFFIFCVFVFFLKKHRKKCFKIDAALFPSKITEKSSPGSGFGSQNGPELTSERSKNPKTAKKIVFGPSSFLNVF